MRNKTLVNGERGIINLSDGQHLLFIDGRIFFVCDIKKQPKNDTVTVTNKQLTNAK